MTMAIFKELFSGVKELESEGVKTIVFAHNGVEGGRRSYKELEDNSIDYLFL